MAMIAPKKAGLPGGGWLSMAPESDDGPKRYSNNNSSAMPAPHSGFSTTVPYAPPPLGGAPRSPTATPLHAPLWGAASGAAIGGSSTTSTTAPAAAAASSYVAPAQASSSTQQATPSRPIRRGGATFQLGAPDSSKCPSPAGLEGSTSSYYGSTRDASPVPFDVRASFAPMPKYGAKLPAIAVTSTSAAALGSKKRSAEYGAEEEEDDGEGITYAGRRWKGKTAHAVELEMEELGDRTIMSYAPDAVYLASRLEGLKRNLDASGGWRKPRYVDYDEETDAGEREVWEQELSRDSEMQTAQDEEKPALQRVDSTSSLVAEGGRTPSPPPSEAALGQLTSVHLTGSALDEGDAEEDQEDGMSSRAASTILGGGEGVAASRRESTRSNATATSGLTHRSGPGLIDWDAKQTALDSRLDVRMLRRPDLEQVRELHCLHGDADKTMDFDTYTTSAGFLIRLLVDEKHVCLVAVAKPLPEPAPLPSGAAFVPHCPPPSLDLPPSKAQYLLAGRGIGAASPYLGAVSAAPPSRFNLGAGWGAPGTAGPPPSVRSSSKDDDASSGATPPDSVFSNLGVGLGIGAAAAAASAAGAGGATTSKTPPTSTGDTSPPDDELRSLSASSKPRARVYTDAILAGPTNAVAPPRAIRVMGAPPPGRRINVDAETILGVASATISTRVVPPTDGGGLWPGIDTNATPALPHHQAHILTLAVAHSERGQGLGARLLDCLLAECKRRACALASKNRRRGSDASPFLNAETLASFPMHTTLEVHASNESALQLYYSRGFRRVQGARGVRHQFYQGDPRVPKTGKNGSDAWVLEHKA